MSIDTKLSADENGVVHISGNLGFATVAALKQPMQDIIAQHEQVSLDLSNVQQCDSAALAFLMNCYRHARKLGKTVLFINLPQSLLALVNVSGLDQIIRLQKD